MMNGTAEIPENWWADGAGFFGESYMIGDDSVAGYLPDRAERLHERTLREVDGVERLLALAPGSTIVDVPCGYGRHSLELSSRGHVVTGVDINEQHLSAMRRKLAALAARPAPHDPGLTRRTRALRVVKQDMRTLCEGLAEPVDAVINMFYSFGFFAEEADNLRAMEQFFRALKERGGKFLMHTDICPEMLDATHYRMSEARALHDGGQLVIEEHFNRGTRRMNGGWTVQRDGKDTSLTPYSVRLYSVDELRSMAHHVGFEKVSFFGSFAGDTFAPTKRELVMVAER